MKNTKKKFKHKWWEYLIFKYKVVEYDNCYCEYERFRNWVIIGIYLLLLLFSPIIVSIFAYEMLIDAFKFPDGENGRDEEYTIYEKEIWDD